MNYISRTLTANAIVMALAISGCSGTSAQEHQRGEKGEDSSSQYAKNETYNEVRYGARLILNYDAKTNSFQGTVENTTNETLKRVRVEVHLSNGIELGPTTPTELAPGSRMAVKLAASSRPFNKWSAHPEVGSGEPGHGEGSEGGGEHGERREGRGEHGERREGRGEHGEGGERGEGDGHEGGEGRGNGRSSPITPIGKSYQGVIDGYVIHIELSACGGSGPEPHGEGREGTGEPGGGERRTP